MKYIPDNKSDFLITNFVCEHKKIYFTFLQMFYMILTYYAKIALQVTYCQPPFFLKNIRYSMCLKHLYVSTTFSNIKEI